MTVLDVIVAFLTGRTAPLEAILASPGLPVIPLQIVALAGLSESIGQSAILFANRVTPRRFIISLFVSALIYVGGFFMWVFSITVVAGVLFQRTGMLSAVAGAVSLSYVPLLFGFLTFLPYLGSPIIKGLYLWAFLAQVAELRFALGLNHAQAVLCSMGGALFILIIRATVGRPVIWLENRVRNWVAGKRLEFDLKTLLDPARYQRRSEDRDRDRRL